MVSLRAYGLLTEELAEARRKEKTMKLTRKKAIALCIEVWTWLAETGRRKKEDWPGWAKYKSLIRREIKDAQWCWFCLYNNRKQRLPQSASSCDRSCPYYKVYGSCCHDSPFGDWFDADTPRTRKKYAKLFLEQIRSLK